MKKLLTTLASFLLMSFAGLTQSVNLPSLDKSPMDMCYYPVNYPVLKIQDKVTEPLVGRVVYSRPQKAGRAVFGELVKLGEVWRMGANEATELQLYKPLKIGGKKIPKGRYTLYAIVNENSWTIIVNKDTDTWGAFKYNAQKDIVRTDLPIEKINSIIESLSMVFEKTNMGCNLIIAWDMEKVALPMNF